MPATFNPALTTPKDRVRQKLGDTNTAAALVQDETIAYYLGLPMGETAAAARLARDLAAKFASEVDSTLDGQSEKASDRSKAFILLADRLEREALAEPKPTFPADPSYVGPIVTGATSSEVMDARCDWGRAANTPLRFP